MYSTWWKPAFYFLKSPIVVDIYHISGNLKEPGINNFKNWRVLLHTTNKRAVFLINTNAEMLFFLFHLKKKQGVYIKPPIGMYYRLYIQAGQTNSSLYRLEFMLYNRFLWFVFPFLMGRNLFRAEEPSQPRRKRRSDNELISYGLIII